MVCVGSTDPSIDGDFDRIETRGRIVYEVDPSALEFDLVPCHEEPVDAIVIETEGGEIQIGYAWILADGSDYTNLVYGSEDEARVVVTSGEGESVGFAVWEDQRLVYAMESGRGGTTDLSEEVGLSVVEGAEVGTVEDDCGTVTRSSLEITSESSDVTLYPGEDRLFDDEDARVSWACNIDSWHREGDCEDALRSEVSWMVF
ncbi:MAG TPA: hypothetical protein QGF58_03545 [Myxococcota bacterium]|nr:hypothetical protein [Myxococcota bacterium]